MIYTGLTALYKKGHIDFKPSSLYFSLQHGVASSRGLESKHGKIRVDWETNTYGKFTEVYDGDEIYTDERLLIELDKWEISSEIRTKAINSLLRKIHPGLLVKTYKFIKKNRRGFDAPLEALEIIRNYEEPISKILNGDDVLEGLNSYLLKLIDDLNLKIVVKGGTAIQGYWDVNRKTQDIDVHAVKKDVESILNNLSDKNNEIRFRPHYLERENNVEVIGKQFNISNLKNYKRVIKLAMVPVISGTKKKFKDHEYVKFTINTSISDIENTINDFQVTKRKIGMFNANVLSFTMEMLIAEKYHSIIVKPSNTTRTKDLIDLFYLLDNYDIKKIWKWLSKKFANSKKSPLKSKEEIIELIKNNKDIELVKIKNDWENATKMYEVEISYEDALSKYNKLTDELI